MSNPYGKFTVRGSPVVEDMITALVDEAACAAQAALQSNEYRALVMIGGYGRGEGGVEIVDGEERPHNNLDFLLIAESPSDKKQKELRRRLLDAFGPVMQKYDIEIDLSVVSTWKLRLTPTLIIWYDMRFGHKTILGNAQYVPSLKRFRLDRIPPRDALRLLVNRGTLLLINEQLLQDNNEAELHRKRITRNIMKAIIGYGDALLFFAGEYHWSYVERKARMQDRLDVPAVFRGLYDEAAEFRFLPDYGKYRNRDLKAWMAELRAVLEPLHLRCERKRLGVEELTWEKYPARALSHALLDEPLSARGWARKALNLAKSSPCAGNFGPWAKLGYRTLGVRGRYPVVFPVVNYHLKDSRLMRFAAGTLTAQDASEETLRKAYLSIWSKEGDINSESMLRHWRVNTGTRSAQRRCLLLLISLGLS